jgi:hypothetical protein
VTTRAPDVIKAVRQHIVDDDTITTILGGAHVYRAGTTRAVRVPSIEWLKVSSPLRENTQRVLLQLDLYGPTYDVTAQLEERLFELLNHDGRTVVIGGINMFAEYDDSRDHPDDATDGQVRQSIDFAFEPARE